MIILPKGVRVLKLKALIGSGDKIMLFTLPFLIIGLILNFMYPEVFSVGGPTYVLLIISMIFLIPGITIWVWTVALILLKVPEGKLIINGPFAIVKHPLYTGVSFLVLPWLGFLLDTWLGVVIGIVMYAASRKYSKEEEDWLLKNFGNEWDEYNQNVKLPWL